VLSAKTEEEGLKDSICDKVSCSRCRGRYLQ